MNDVIPGTRVEGKILLDGEDIYAPDVDVVELRRRVGMVFQKSNPFPKSIFDNIAYGLRINGMKDKRKLEEVVERSLRGAALWDEVKDRLDDNAFALSGGQQQRLCIARALAVEPEVILFDEPCSAIDPIATAKIEDLIEKLKKRYTVVIVTHNMQQAARVSDYTAFMMLGELVEFDVTEKIFTEPGQQAHRGLHHRAVRMTGRGIPRRSHVQDGKTFRRRTEGCSRRSSWRWPSRAEE